MTMTSSVASAVSSSPRVRWTWLWSARSDVMWNFLPFALGFVLIGILYASRNLGGADHSPMLNFMIGGHPVHLTALMMYLYGPLVDAPHLWATVARTYTDKEEWATRRRLFIGSLVWFVIGPIVILLPHGLRALSLLPAGAENSGWIVWTHFFTLYALFHINKQHWGFVSLYKRKNADFGDARENRIDQLFFYVGIWSPFVAMMSAPWYLDFDGKPFAFTVATGGVLHIVCHALFLGACVAYTVYQLSQWRRGVARNGPKLAYLALILSLNYLAFAIHPVVAAFWVLTTGLGHCAQYHRVVWAYGQSKYAGKAGAERKLPAAIFENAPLYAVLGVVFGLLTLQSFGSGAISGKLAGALDTGLFSHAFAYLNRSEGLALALKVVGAFVSGVRLHHFYVDSKIWRVGKTAGLAKELNVAA